MPRAILFARGGALGDFILTLPALRLLREAFPGARVEVLGYAKTASLALAAGLADEALSLENAPMHLMFASGIELPVDLTRNFARFDLAVSYVPDPDGTFQDNLSRCGISQILRCPSKPTEPGPPAAADQFAAPLRELGLTIPAGPLHPCLNLGDVGRASAERFLCDVSGQRLVAVHPGSGGRAKNWPASRWLALMRRLASDDSPPQFVIVSGEAEEGLPREFWTSLAELIGLRADNLPLPVLGQVLARCQLFLGHDSGVSHLAAAVGAPCRLLFGPTDPSVWAPRNPDVAVLRSTSGRMEDLSVEAVWEFVTSPAAAAPP